MISKPFFYFYTLFKGFSNFIHVRETPANPSLGKKFQFNLGFSNNSFFGNKNRITDASYFTKKTPLKENIQQGEPEQKQNRFFPFFNSSPQESKKEEIAQDGNANADTPEKQLDNTPEKQLDNTQEKQLDNTQEKQLDNTPEKQLDNTQEKQLDNTQEKQLDNTQEKQLDNTQEKKLDVSDIKSQENIKKGSDEKTHDETQQEKKERDDYREAAMQIDIKGEEQPLTQSYKELFQERMWIEKAMKFKLQYKDYKIIKTNNEIILIGELFVNNNVEEIRRTEFKRFLEKYPSVIYKIKSTLLYKLILA